ncbi:MAG TPA: hypothetical protein VFU05_18370 [Cyclobacteriaceae bacterium]|nr:hypothetical protein [Cyclobacteriaceae bacterium]
MEMEQTGCVGHGLNEIEPDIDRQIEYVNYVRNHIVKHIKPLQNELRMIRAIEQTLIAAKWLAWPYREEKKYRKVTLNNRRTVAAGTSKKREKN